MYNLYDLFRDRDSIIKSIGLEYNNLSYESSLILLIFNAKLFNILDNDSVNVTNNNQFHKLLSNIKYCNDYKNMYLLDAILLNVNTESSRSLIQLYGSNRAKDKISNPILPSEILTKILLEQTDIDTIINLYNTSTYYRSLLNNSDFLQQLMVNIYYKLKPLPGSRPITFPPIKIEGRWDDFTRDITIYKINQLLFDEFVLWYKYNYYSFKNCIRSLIICYCGARDNDDIEGVNKYYSELYDIPPKYLEELVNIEGVSEIDKYYMLYRSITVYPLNNKLFDDDIEIYYLYLLNFIDALIDMEFKVDTLVASLTNERLFKIIWSILIEKLTMAEKLEIFKDVEKETFNQNVSFSYMLYYDYVKHIEKVLGEAYVLQLINHWEESLNFTCELYDDSITDEEIKYVLKLLDLLRKYVGDNNIKQATRNIIDNFEEIADYYSEDNCRIKISKILEDYISNIK